MNEQKNENAINTSQEIDKLLREAVPQPLRLPTIGDYTGRLVSAKLDKARFTHKDQVVVQYSLEKESGDLNSYFTLNQNGVPHLRKWICRLGYPQPTTREELRILLERISVANPWVKVRAVENKGFIYGILLGRVDPPSEPPEAQPAEPYPKPGPVDDNEVANIPQPIPGEGPGKVAPPISALCCLK